VPGGAFFIGQSIEHRSITDRSEIRIAPPLSQPLPNGSFLRGIVLWSDLSVGSQIVAQPAKRPVAEHGHDLVGQQASILALSSSGQYGAAGGVVAMLCIPVRRKAGFSSESIGIEAGSSDVFLLVLLAPLCQKDSLAGIGGRGFALKHRRQFAIEGTAEIIASLNELGIKGDGLAIASDGAVLITFVPQGITEVVVGRSILRIEGDSLVIASDGAVPIAFLMQGASEIVEVDPKNWTVE
jgi:hypothetical protein